jgi:hypothetical protein
VRAQNGYYRVLKLKIKKSLMLYVFLALKKIKKGGAV